MRGRRAAAPPYASNPKLAAASLAATIADRRRGPSVYYEGVRVHCPHCGKITEATQYNITVPPRRQPRLGGMYPDDHYGGCVCAECGADLGDVRVLDEYATLSPDGRVIVDLRP